MTAPRPTEEQLRQVEAGIATGKEVHDLLVTKVEAQERVRVAKVELAKAESALSKAEQEHSLFEIEALRKNLELQEARVKEQRDPARVLSVSAVLPPSGLIKK